MERKEFLTTWKNIPAENEVQYTLDNCECNAGEFVRNQNLTRKAKKNPVAMSLDKSCPPREAIIVGIYLSLLRRGGV